MLQGTKRTFEDFAPHPEGRFNGIIYAFKAYPKKGEKDQWGNDTKHNLMLRIKSLDCMIDDPESEYNGKPQSVGLFFWYSFGDSEKRSGNYYPAMQENRETILDRPLTEEEWWNFDPNTLMGIRVRYRIQHKPKDNPKSENDIWVNVKIVEQLEDQSLGTQVNETSVDVTAIEGASAEPQTPAGNPPAPSGSGSAPPPSPAPKPPSQKVVTDPKALSFAIDVVSVLVKADCFTEEEADQWQTYLSNPDTTNTEFKEAYMKLEKAIKENELELPPCEVHPLSDDDLPF